MTMPDTNYPTKTDAALADYVDALLAGHTPKDNAELNQELETLQALSQRIYHIQKDYPPPPSQLSAQRISIMQTYRREFTASEPVETFFSKIEKFFQINPRALPVATAAAVATIVIGMVTVFGQIGPGGVAATAGGNGLALPLTILGVGLLVGVVLLWLRRR